MKGSRKKIKNYWSFHEDIIYTKIINNLLFSICNDQSINIFDLNFKNKNGHFRNIITFYIEELNVKIKIIKNYLILYDKIISIYDMDKNFKFIKKLDKYKSKITCIEIYDNYLISCSKDEGINICDLTNFTICFNKKIEYNFLKVKSFKDYIISNTRNSLLIYKLNNNNFDYSHTIPIKNRSFKIFNNKIYICSYNKWNIFKFNLNKFEFITAIYIKSIKIYKFKNDKIFISCYKFKIKIYDENNYNLIKTVNNCVDIITHIFVSDNLLIVSSNNSKVYVFNIKNNLNLVKIVKHYDESIDYAIYYNNYLITSTLYRQIVIYDYELLTNVKNEKYKPKTKIIANIKDKINSFENNSNINSKNKINNESYEIQKESKSIKKHSVKNKQFLSDKQEIDNYKKHFNKLNKKCKNLKLKQSEWLNTEIPQILKQIEFLTSEILNNTKKIEKLKKPSPKLKHPKALSPSPATNISNNGYNINFNTLDNKWILDLNESKHYSITYN